MGGLKKIRLKCWNTVSPKISQSICGLYFVLSRLEPSRSKYYQLFECVPFCHEFVREQSPVELRLGVRQFSFLICVCLRLCPFWTLPSLTGSTSCCGLKQCLGECWTGVPWGSSPMSTCSRFLSWCFNIFAESCCVQLLSTWDARSCGPQASF